MSTDHADIESNPHVRAFLDKCHYTPAWERPPLMKLTGAEFPRLEDGEWGKRKTQEDDQ